mgnify:CR=1 FL=1
MLHEGKIYFIDISAVSTVPDTYRLVLFRFFDALTGDDSESCVDHVHSMSAEKVPPRKLRDYRDIFLDYIGILRIRLFPKYP